MVNHENSLPPTGEREGGWSWSIRTASGPAYKAGDHTKPAYKCDPAWVRNDIAPLASRFPDCQCQVQVLLLLVL